MPGSQHHALQAAASSSTIQSSEASSGFLEFDQDERFSTTSRPWKWLQDASRVAQKLSPANLRDVSTGASVEQDTLPVHMVASSSISASRETTAFLDGMRGIAAFCVVVEHFAIPFQPTMFHGFQGVEHSHFLQLPIIRLCYNGSSMVCIFFVISGFALSVKPVRMIGEKDWDSFYREMESAIFRRGIRLFIPVVVVSFTMMLAAHTGLADVQSDVKYEGSPAIHSAFWLRQPVSIPGFWHQLKDWLRFILSMVLIPGTWRGTGRGYEYVELKQSQYGTQFWTIPVEYWSSILLFAALIGTARAHTISRWATLIALTCLSMAIGRWDVGLFFYGSLLAQVTRLGSGISMMAKPVKLLHETLWTLLFCVGLFMASSPDEGFSHAHGYVWLSAISNDPRLWQSVGAAQIVTGASKATYLRHVFSHGYFLYLGRISYALYIVHVGLLLTLGWRLVPVIWEVTGRNTQLQHRSGFVVAFLLLLPMLFWVAEVYYRLVDRPCTLYARKLENRSKVSD